jgi:predicted Zn-dependent protease with MMP-like domain
MSRPQWSGLNAPSLDDFSDLGRAALEALPDLFRHAAGDLLIRVEDFPQDDLLDRLGIDDAFALTGVFDGTPMTTRSVLDTPAGPNCVILFRRPILDEWSERGDVSLYDLITHVLVHEIGHHFGLSDDDIHRIEDGH